jgi:hypothetical protein
MMEPGMFDEMYKWLVFRIVVITLFAVAVVAGLVCLIVWMVRHLNISVN